MPPKRASKPPPKAADAFAALARTGPVKLKRKSFPVLPSAAKQSAAAESARASSPIKTASPLRTSSPGHVKHAKLSISSDSHTPSGLSSRKSPVKPLQTTAATAHNASVEAAKATAAQPVPTASKSSSAPSTLLHITSSTQSSIVNGSTMLYNSGTVTGEVLGMAFLNLLAGGQLSSMANTSKKSYAQSVAVTDPNLISPVHSADSAVNLLLQVSNAVVRAEFEVSGSDGTVVESGEGEAGCAKKPTKKARIENCNSPSGNAAPIAAPAAERKRVRFCTFDLTSVDSTQRDVGTSAYILPYTEPHAPEEASELFDIGGKLTQPAVSAHSAAACSPNALQPPLPVATGGTPVPGAAGACGVHSSHMLHKLDSGAEGLPSAPWADSLPPEVASALPVSPAVALAYAADTAVHCAARPGGPERRARSTTALPEVNCSKNLPPPTAHGTPLWLRPPVDALAHALHIVMEAATAAHTALHDGPGAAVFAALLQQLQQWSSSPPPSVQFDGGVAATGAPHGSSAQAAPSKKTAARGSKRPRTSGVALSRRVHVATFAAAARCLQEELSAMQNTAPTREQLQCTVHSSQSLLGTQFELQLPSVQPHLPFQQRYAECVSSLFRHHLRRAFNCQAWDDAEEQMMQLRLALLQYGDSDDSDEDMAVAEDEGGDEYLPEGGDASSTAGAAGGGSELDASFAVGDKGGLGLDSISGESLSAMAAAEAACLAAAEATAAAPPPSKNSRGGARRGRSETAVISDSASVASADTAATAASRASVPGGGAGVGMGAGGGPDGTFVSIDGDGPGAGSLKYNGEDLGALVYKALCSLHWGRPIVHAVIAPHSLAEGPLQVLEAPPGGSAGASTHPLTLQQCVDKASVGDLATVVEFCAAHRFLMQLTTAEPLLAAVASGGDAWVSLERLAAHVLAWNLVEEQHCGAFADIAALGRALRREASVVTHCSSLATTTLQRHHRALSRERAKSNTKGKRKSVGRSGSSARSAMAAAGWRGAAVGAGDEGGAAEGGDPPLLLRPSEGSFDAQSDSWRFGRASGLSARGALLLAFEALLSPSERFEYPTVSWVQGGGCDLGSIDGEAEGGDAEAQAEVAAAVGQAAGTAAAAASSKGTLFDIVTALHSSPPKGGKGGKDKDVPPSPAAFPFSG